MAIQFSSSIKNLMIGRGLRDGFVGASAVTLYKGTAPTPAQILASWSSYNSSSANYLVHFLSSPPGGVAWIAPSDGILLQYVPTPTTSVVNTVINSGDATWAILWSTNPSLTNMAAASIPTTQFIVVSVSNSDGSGVIRLSNTTLVAGQQVSILDGSIGASLI